MIENAEIYNDYFSDYSDACKYSSSAGEFICFNFFIKSYVFPPQQEDGGVPPPEITLGNDSNLLIVFYVQIMPDDLVMQLHLF
ncbi:hypothetical protein NL418_022405 [Escherichia coli]|nr:hypothetical protein [Escherichia coli]WCQ53018.1 hypothetical protein NL418_022405 [Escherichia coli]